MKYENDALGNRMKAYEARYNDHIFMPCIPIISRCDGRAFHTFTKDLDRPYCLQLSQLMIETTKYLVRETNARCGYVQSDEITLVWLAEQLDQEIFFGGRKDKMATVIASMASAFFNFLLPTWLPQKAEPLLTWRKLQSGPMPVLPVFDNRVFQVPTEWEATNCFIWREADATRNSVQMAARAYYDHTECVDKSNSELQEMLFSRGINWNDYPAFFKRGTYVRTKAIELPFSTEELDALPPKHHARRNPDLKVLRREILAEELPPLARLINREDVILRGVEPVVRDADR
jgi:tRNA(His) guanylyltransferase